MEYTSEITPSAYVTHSEVNISRVQPALNVDDLDSSITFYSKLFGTEEELNTTCCFATGDKVWVTAPDDERWEVYTKLADAESFGAADPTADACDCGPQAAG